MKISIQGIKGAFHEEAAKNYFNSEIEIVPQKSFDDVIHSVLNHESDYGVMAIENTISGTIHTNLNLIRQSGLKIKDEVFLPIKQNLVALPGTKIEDLNQVNSHHMALDQCREFFRKYPKIRLVESEDTALSIKHIAKHRITEVAAIGSRLAAEYYGLEIIADGIETNKKNYTRFLILEKENNEISLENDKASLAITLAHKKGSLAIILNIISFYDINLTKIESVPVIGEPWHYLFYFDLQFNETKNYHQMLHALKPLVDEMQILGEYKSGNQFFNQVNQNQNEVSRQN
jgi:prephenate dehydratase